MTDNAMINILTSYKKTAAFLAAFQLGIFEHMRAGPVDVDELAMKAGADRQMLEYLLHFLKSEGLVESEGGLWRIAEGFRTQVQDTDSYENLISHERNLYHRWATPDSIAACVQQGIGNRMFDILGFGFQEKITYWKAMNGKNLQLIAFWLRRELNRKNSVSVLEFGRSAGALCNLLQNKISVADLHLAITSDFLDVYEKEVRPNFQLLSVKAERLEDFAYSGKYDLICIYNTIHYYNEDELVTMLSRLQSTMNQSSVLCIADIFFKNDEHFNASVALDWITHGGVFNLHMEDLDRIINKSGFGAVKHKSLPEIATDLFFCKATH